MIVWRVTKGRARGLQVCVVWSWFLLSPDLGKTQKPKNLSHGFAGVAVELTAEATPRSATSTASSATGRPGPAASARGAAGTAPWWSAGM